MERAAGSLIVRLSPTPCIRAAGGVLGMVLAGPSGAAGGAAGGPGATAGATLAVKGRDSMSSLLTPVLALNVWTLIVWIWMYATRIPAMNAARIDPDTAKHPGSLDALPTRVRAVADNYNHLMEQPTIFYAL